jgi:hypothetical protein
MTTSDWIINIALVAVVVFQLKERRFSWHAMLLPLAGVGYAALSYLQAIPTAGNDLVLIALTVATGTVLGVAGGLTTHVRPGADGTRFRASATSAGLWVLGTGARLAFVVWITHGGAGALGRFSVAHDITGGAAWVDATVLMVLVEVVSRTAIIVARAARAGRVPAAPPAAEGILVGGR